MPELSTCAADMVLDLLCRRMSIRQTIEARFTETLGRNSGVLVLGPAGTVHGRAFGTFRDRPWPSLSVVCCGYNPKTSSRRHSPIPKYSACTQCGKHVSTFDRPLKSQFVPLAQSGHYIDFFRFPCRELIPFSAEEINEHPRSGPSKSQ